VPDIAIPYWLLRLTQFVVGTLIIDTVNTDTQ